MLFSAQVQVSSAIFFFFFLFLENMKTLWSASVSNEHIYLIHFFKVNETMSSRDVFLILHPNTFQFNPGISNRARLTLSPPDMQNFGLSWCLQTAGRLQQDILDLLVFSKLWTCASLSCSVQQPCRAAVQADVRPERLTWLSIV